MKWIRPLPRTVTRPLSFAILIAWVATMALLVDRSYLQASVNLATDLSRYGSDARWQGVYYRGAKIGFTVRQVLPVDGGFELQEDGQLELTLLGATAAAKLKTTARVDDAFVLQSFEFSLDPGTGPITVGGRVEEVEDGADGATWHLLFDVTSGGVTRTETRELTEPPMLTLNMGRRLASEGLAVGKRHTWMVFDPATLTNAPVVLDVGAREIVRVGGVGGAPTPAFRVDVEFHGLRTTSWVTDTGEVVREESPLGLLTLREPADRAIILAVPGRIQTDLLDAAAVVPKGDQRIDDPRNVERLRVRLEGADLSSQAMQGAGQTVEGDIVEIVDAKTLVPRPPESDLGRFLQPEPLIESDAPEIIAEAELAAGAFVGDRARAEELTRYVNGLLDKKPTVSLPSAVEVLRTKIGDCNEHTALYVAMARALGIPTRIAVGLVHMRGAFYYHAWPEVYLAEPDGRGLWLPVDPTLNQFPADATHLRLARGGLDQQVAILPMIGRLDMTILELDVVPDSTPVFVGTPAANIDVSALPVPVPVVSSRGWCGCSER